MSCHIWSRYMVFLPCGSFHVFLISLLSCVGPFMILQSTSLSKCLVTFGAGILCFSRVDPFVCFQMANLASLMHHSTYSKWTTSRPPSYHLKIIGSTEDSLFLLSGGGGVCSWNFASISKDRAFVALGFVWGKTATPSSQEILE